MKEAIVHKDGHVDIVDAPVPMPAAGEVLIKVVVAGSNPKDWKYPFWTGSSGNTGDDAAGIVTKIGAGVTEFHVGDRVAVLHVLRGPYGTFAEYAIAPAHTTFHIPAGTSFEEAATLPLAALTAAVALYAHLKLPEPWVAQGGKLDDGTYPEPAPAPTPLLVHGGAGAVGAFAIQFARRSNVHPIIAVAGQSAPFVESLLDKSQGDTVVDYRTGDVGKALQDAVKTAVKGDHLAIQAIDATSEHDSNVQLAQALQPTSESFIVGVLPWKDGPPGSIAPEIRHVTAMVAHVHTEPAIRDLGFVYSRYISRGLAEGWLHPHPHKVVEPAGLAGIETGLRGLREGKAHGFKYVFRLSDEK